MPRLLKSTSGDPEPAGRARVALILVVASVMLVIVVIGSGRTAYSQSPRGLDEVLYGEALHASNRQDLLVAISRLLNAKHLGAGGSLPPSQALMLASLATEYGLYEEASSILAGIPRANVPGDALDRAWYSLARVDFERGRSNEALESLDRMGGSLSFELDADRTLLLGQVMLALGNNERAVAVLKQWRGPESQAPYASYNLGVAQLRAGHSKLGLRSLERASTAPGKSDDVWALRDKANLALGYALAEQGSLRRARQHFERVRSDGPYASAALLATGWVELERDQPEAALKAWLVLHERAASDPAVQESLLVVPSVQMELNQLPGAARRFELAVSSYNQQLEQLGSAHASLAAGVGIETLLDQDVDRLRRHAKPDEVTSAASHTQYLGDVIARGGYQALVRDYGDLAALESSLLHWLDSVDALNGILDGRLPPHRKSLPNAQPSALAPPDVAVQRARRKQPIRPDAVQSSDAMQREAWEHASRALPPASPMPGPLPKRELPELELPPEQPVEPLPDSAIVWLPGGPEDVGLPGSDEVGLPEETEFLDPDLGGVAFLPDGSSWNQQRDDSQSLPYPPFPFEDPPEAGAADPRSGAPSGVDPGSGVVSASDDMPRLPPSMADLGFAIEGARQRTDALQRALGSAQPDQRDFRARLAALRARIAALGPWVERIMAMHEAYVQDLAIAELERRQLRLEAYLERARLDLARTYDRASER